MQQQMLMIHSKNGLLILRCSRLRVARVIRLATHLRGLIHSMNRHHRLPSFDLDKSLPRLREQSYERRKSSL